MATATLTTDATDASIETLRETLIEARRDIDAALRRLEKGPAAPLKTLKTLRLLESHIAASRHASATCAALRQAKGQNTPQAAQAAADAAIWEECLASIALAHDYGSAADGRPMIESYADRSDSDTLNLLLNVPYVLMVAIGEAVPAWDRERGNSKRSSISDLITAHELAWRRFTASCDPMDSVKTGREPTADEVATYEALGAAADLVLENLCKTKCENADDLKLKFSYLVNGPARVMDYLTGEEHLVRAVLEAQL